MTYQWIQLLRAAAATSVVAFHAHGTALRYVPDTAPFLSFLNYGSAGVELFFVISGFIIFLTANGRERSAGTFLRRRIERVVPIYWLYTIGFAFLVLLTQPRGNMPGIDLLLRSLMFVSFTLPSFPVAYVGWSLEYEMFFYLLVALGLAVRRPFWDLIVIALSALVVLGAIARPDAPVLAFLTSPILLNFCWGTLIARSVVGGRIPLLGSITAAAAIVIALVFADQSLRVISGGLAAVIVAAAALADEAGWVPKGRLFRAATFVGDASYSIYLVQIVSIPLVMKPMLWLLPGAGLFAVTIVVIFGTILLGLASYLLVERPIAKLLRARQRAMSLAGARGG